MDFIFEKYSLGSRLIASNIYELEKSKISELVCCEPLMEKLDISKNIRVLHLPIYDYDEKLGEYLDDCKKFLHRSSRVLFYCHYGLNRSAVVLISQLATQHQLPFTVARKLVGRLFPINPRKEMLILAKQWTLKHLKT